MHVLHQNELAAVCLTSTQTKAAAGSALPLMVLAARSFPHGLTALGWEEAIEHCEDWLMPQGKLVSGTSLQLTGHWGVHALMPEQGWQTSDIERLFLDTATPSGERAWQARWGDQALRMAVELTLLRECMHHWRLTLVQ